MFVKQRRKPTTHDNYFVIVTHLTTQPEEPQTMLSKADRRKAAQILLTAEAERKPALQLSKTFPDITIEDAYAIQSEVDQAESRRRPPGARPQGGPHVQGDAAVFQIDEPDYGHLMDYMFFADGAKIPFERFIVPRVEIELAFVLGQAAQGPGRRAGGRAARDPNTWSRRSRSSMRGWQNPRKIFDTVSDNGAPPA